MSRRFSLCHQPMNLLLLLLLYSAVQANNNDLLNEDSVVIITGAAGFIGSELAMALHRTYNPKKLLLIDSMENGFGNQKTKDTSTTGHRTERDLSLLEFKRQRVFHMLQTLGTKAHFYRVDFRPNIPEFYDPGQVPVLHHIVRQHPDITHIVHLADHYHASSEAANEEIQAVPRVAGQPKAGMMESLLEHLTLMGNETNRVPPHFTYASSHQVYSHHSTYDNNPNPPPFDESKPITTPSSLAGATKLLDEILAQTYYDLYKINSLGLRFFCVYGPWGLPGSALFEMTERAVTASSVLLQANDRVDDVWDYIYIDDAVDAIMTAMQLRVPEQPLVVNVGTGQGATLRSVAQQIQEYIPTAQLGMVGATEHPTISYASTDRAKQLLGFEPRVSLAQGLENLLAWQYDRAFPYGGRAAAAPEDNINNNSTYDISSKGIASCSRYDSECLRGMPVFPCASECSHEAQCISTAFDDVYKYTRLLTATCETVMYTVALDNNLVSIPSAAVQVSTKSKSHVDDGSGHCNIAFVNEASPLVHRLKTDSSAKSRDGVLKHGFWSVVPMTITKIAAKNLHMLRLLPKLSPGLLFSSNRAIYCDPDVIFDSIPALLEEASMQPYNEEVEGATAMLIGKRRDDSSSTSKQSPSAKGSVQEHAYRMIRIAVFDEMTGDDFQQHVDSSFIVHTLNNVDSRFFRCDVYGEVVQWDVETDNASLEFVMGLHDMWSRVIARKSGQEPWWTGDDVETVRSSEQVAVDRQRRRRLQEEDEDEEDADSAEEEEVEEAFAHNGFGVENRVPGEAKRKDAAEKKREEPIDEEEGMDDVEEAEEGEQVEDEARDMLHEDKDLASNPSSYDVWMGVLSSTETKYFARIVSAEAVGAVHLDEYSGPKPQSEL